MDRVKDDIIEACIRYFVQHISIPILLGYVAGPEISEGQEFVKYTYQDIIWYVTMARAEEGDVLIVMICEDNELHISKLEEDVNE